MVCTATEDDGQNTARSLSGCFRVREILNLPKTLRHLLQGYLSFTKKGLVLVLLSFVQGQKTKIYLHEVHVKPNKKATGQATSLALMMRLLRMIIEALIKPSGLLYALSLLNSPNTNGKQGFVIKGNLF